ncbi:PREDICTED: uncharacterized protein LOC101297484 [Fragaria vesca subsp. vesca]
MSALFAGTSFIPAHSGSPSCNPPSFVVRDESFQTRPTVLFMLAGKGSSDDDSATMQPHLLGAIPLSRRRNPTSHLPRREEDAPSFISTPSSPPISARQRRR